MPKNIQLPSAFPPPCPKRLCLFLFPFVVHFLIVLSFFSSCFLRCSCFCFFFVCVVFVRGLFWCVVFSLCLFCGLRVSFSFGFVFFFSLFVDYRYLSCYKCMYQSMNTRACAIGSRSLSLRPCYWRHCVRCYGPKRVQGALHCLASPLFVILWSKNIRSHCKTCVLAGFWDLSWLGRCEPSVCVFVLVGVDQKSLQKQPKTEAKAFNPTALH